MQHTASCCCPEPCRPCHTAQRHTPARTQPCPARRAIFMFSHLSPILTPPPGTRECYKEDAHHITHLQGLHEGSLMQNQRLQGRRRLRRNAAAKAARRRASLALRAAVLAALLHNGEAEENRLATGGWRKVHCSSVHCSLSSLQGQVPWNDPGSPQNLARKDVILR